MSVVVRKATDTEKEQMKSMPVWTCPASTFDWYYDSEEVCLIVEGEVTVEYEGGSVSFGPGDYVVFPQGLKCVWKVTKPVKKHYFFRAEF